MKLPDFFKSLLWSYNFSDIDTKKNKKTIIINTVNYGDLKHWKWIINNYGKETIAEVLSRISAFELRPGARKLASIVFDIKEFNYERRGVR